MPPLRIPRPIDHRATGGRAAEHRLPHLPGQAPRRRPGRLHPSPHQGPGRPGPPRRGPRRPALPDPRRPGPAGRAAQPRHLQRLLPDADAGHRGSSRRSATGVEVTSFSLGHLPRAAGLQRAGLPAPAHPGQRLRPGAGQPVPRLRPARPWSASGLPVLATIHHPITVDRRLEMEHAETGWQRFSKARWYAFTKMQTRVAPAHDPGHHRVAELPRRHLHRPRGRRSTACTSCPSASTRTSSARSPTSSASPAGSSPPPAPTSP